MLSQLSVRLSYALSLLLLLTSCAKSAASPTFVKPEAVNELIAKGAILLDVRTPAEFASGHIRGARNLSVDSVDFPTAARALDKQAIYIVHCSANVPKGRTDRAIEKFRAAGLKNLNSMEGGIEAWKKRGLPVE